MSIIYEKQMKQNIHAVAISASREKNGIKERYVGVKKDGEGFFDSKIEWNWYPENSIGNTNKLFQKMNEHFSSSIDQTPSVSPYKGIGRRPKNSRKKGQSTTKGDETPSFKHIQMMEGDLLYSINTENPKLDPYTKLHFKSTNNDNNNPSKKITKILSCSLNQMTGQITWKVKIEENNRTIEIPHAELVINNRDLFMEYCKTHFVENKIDDSS